MLFKEILRTSTIYTDSPQSSVRLIQDYKKTDQIHIQDSDTFNALTILGIVDTAISDIGLTQEQILEIKAIISDVSNLVTQSELNEVIASIPDISGLATYAQLVEVKNTIPNVSDFVTRASLASQLDSTTTSIEGWANSRFALNTSLELTNAALTAIYHRTGEAETAISIIDGKLVGITGTVRRYVDEAIEYAVNNIDFTLFYPVTELPEEGRTNKIYLVPAADKTDFNRWEEWIWTRKPDSEMYSWEMLGTIEFAVDLGTAEWVEKYFLPLIGGNLTGPLSIFNELVATQPWTKEFVNAAGDNLKEWVLDQIEENTSKDQQTVDWVNANFLKLTGGNLTGHVILNNAANLQGRNAAGGAYQLIGISSSNNILIGATPLNTYLYGNVVNIGGTTNNPTYFNGTINYTLLHTGNYSSYALPLSGGNVSGVIVLNNNINIQGRNTAGSGYNMLSMSSGNAVSLGNSTYTTAIYGTDFIYNGNKIFHAGNANLSTISWNALNLSAAGTLAVTGATTLTGVLNANGSIRLPNNVALSANNASGTAYNIAYISTANNIFLGNASAAYTYISSGAYDLQHGRGGTNYTILDTYNLSTYALPIAGGTITGSLSVGGSASIAGALKVSSGLEVTGNLLNNGLQVATQAYVNDKMSDIDFDLFVIVSELPATGTLNKIYLIPSPEPGANNVWLEYSWIDGAWELLGSVQVDLTGMATEQWTKDYVGELTIDSLKNVEGFDNVEVGTYAFAAQDGMLRPVAVSSIGGGSFMDLTFVSDSITSAAYGSDAYITFNFISLSGERPTGSGACVVKVGTKIVISKSIPQGDNSINIGPYLAQGDNEVTVTVTDVYNTSRTLTYSINAIVLSISSIFNPAIPITTETFTYYFTPIGLVEKTVHFLVDDVEVATYTTTASNRQLYQELQRAGHGNHSLEVYMTANVGGVDMRSASLHYDMIHVVAGNMTPIIESSFRATTANQYETITIPYIVYDPASLTTDITLEVDGVEISALNVDRTQQHWNYRLTNHGSISFTIRCGAVSRTFVVGVAKSDITVEAETSGLELFLASTGRSNNETNRAEWKYGSISASLTDFNWETNGWLADDEGSVALQISKGASVTIPYKPFSTDFRSTGKAIEFEFEASDIIDYDTVIISCMDNTGKGIRMTAQEALMKSEQVEVSAKYKEDERTRVSFVVESTAEGRLLFVYVDGIASGVIQYPTDDNFQQASPLNITIGSSHCTTRLYVVRAYRTGLTQFQILNNYIADMDIFDRKIDTYQRNQLYDAYGAIDYEKAVKSIPCMTITGTLPTYKGDKKTVSVDYDNRQDTAKSFASPGVTIDVQGTSSQFYPRKNYKTKHSTFITEAGTITKYSLRENSIPVNTFCQKADFAESSSTHNTGWSRLVQDICTDMNLKTPPQKSDDRVRTTIDGFPILMFHKATASSTPEFLGKYNFNNDKSTQETFGFEGAAECWEVLNNTSDRVLFRSADFTGTSWLTDFEGRYPDGHTDPTNLAILSAWIVSCIGNPAKFKAETAEHFNKDFLLFYYLATELVGSVDQRAKNMMLASWGNEGSGAFKWYPIFYDSDTILGLNNEGLNVFGYNIESRDIIDQQYVFNGANSELWNLVEEAFSSEMATMYYNMRVNRNITYDRLLEMFNDEQSSRWVEVVYNMDMKFKYVDPFINNNENYLDVLQGSRASHRNWWLYNRFRYIDSKYSAGDYLNDQIYLRLYTPTIWSAVQPNSDFDITLGVGQYVKVKYGSYPTESIRAQAGDTVHVQAPAIQFNDTEAYIYGASRIRSLGDLSSQYAGSVDLSKATRLTEVIIGSGLVGYQNNNLLSLSLGNNTLLRTVDIRNCPSYKSALDLSGCGAIEAILAQGSGITAVNLASAGILTELRLPGTLTNLTLKNQAKLTSSGFSLDGYANLSTIVIENTPGVSGFNIAQAALSAGTKLNRVRITGVDEVRASLSVLLDLIKVGGIDEFGNNTDVAFIQGKFTSNSPVLDSDLAKVSEAFPYLDITVAGVIPAPAVTFTFASSQNKALTNLNIVSNVGYTVVSATSIKFQAEEGTAITLTVTADYHVDFTYSYVLTLTTSRSLTLTYIPLRTVYVREYTTSAAVSGATVSWSTGELQTTNTSGVVSLRGSQARTFTAFYSGKGSGRGEIAESTTDTTTYVYLYTSILFAPTFVGGLYAVPLWNVAISIESDGDFIGTYKTDINGLINAYVPAYSPIVVKAIVTDETITVGTFNTTSTAYVSTITISSSNEELYRPIMNDPTSMYLTVGYYGNNTLTSGYGLLTITVAKNTPTAFTIVYADGTTKIGHVNNTDSDVSASYQFYNNTHISIKNCEGIISIVRATSTTVIFALWSIGTSQIKNMSFDSMYTGVNYIGNSMFFIGPADDIFKNDDRTNLDYVFRYSGVLNLNSNYFQTYLNKENILSMNYSFQIKSTVSSPIPLMNLDGFSGVTSLYYTFSTNNSVTEIPERWLSDMPLLTQFVGVFTGTNITSLPSDLFSYANSIEGIQNLIYDVSGIREISANIVKNTSSLTGIQSIFQNSHLDNIPTGVFDGLVNVVNASYCFSDSKNIKSIPDNLFKDFQKVNTLYYAFSGCSSLESISEKIFEFTSINPTNLNYCFQYCTGLTHLPSNFGKNENVASVEYTFFGCTGLTDAPEYIFQEFGKIPYADGLFRSCSLLASTPKYIGPYKPEGSNLQNCTMNHTFNGCALTDDGISEDILSNFPDSLNLTINLSYCFAGSSHRYKKVPNIFKNQSRYIGSMSYAFYASNIEEIVAGVIESDFGNPWRVVIDAATPWHSCFSYCQELRYIGPKAFDKAFYRDSETADIQYAPFLSYYQSMCANCQSLTVAYYPTSLMYLQANFCWSSTLAYNQNLKAIIFERLTLHEVYGNTITYFPLQSYCPYLRLFVPDTLLDAYKTATFWVANADMIYPLREYPGDDIVLADGFNWTDWDAAKA